jgi:hypothetical protein
VLGLRSQDPTFFKKNKDYNERKIRILVKNDRDIKTQGLMKNGSDLVSYVKKIM